MEVSFIDLKAQYKTIRPEIDTAIEAVFESGQFIGGPFVGQFETSFASLLGVPHCIAVGNGTDATFIALKSLGIKSGDEVITPAFAWISSAETITLAGATPVFSDILPETFDLDPEKLESKITDRTKGVVLVHLYGQPGQAHRIRRICEKHRLFLIEDCAQAHLSEELGVKVGGIGHAGVFSFYPTKNLGAYGDGGCVTTADIDLEKNVRRFANHGGLHEHVMEGMNSRLDSLQAAVLSVKCRHLSQWTDQRILHAKWYGEGLDQIEPISLPKVRPDTKHAFHQYVVRTSHRKDLATFLASRGVQTMVHYPLALPNLPAYRHFHHKKEDFPVANQCQEEVLSLPIHPDLSQDQIHYVCEMIRQFHQR